MSEDKEPSPIKTFCHDPINGRTLAIDYGDKRVGIAVTDPLNMFASGLPTIERSEKVGLIDQLISACERYPLKTILIGLPLHMDGSESEKSQQVRTFADEISHCFDGPVRLVDERLSSFEAEERLKAQGIQPSRNKGLVDQMAAKILLEDTVLG